MPGLLSGLRWTRVDLVILLKRKVEYSKKYTDEDGLTGDV